VGAVARRKSVGIDVEAVRPIPELLRISSVHFSPAEDGALRALGEAARVRAFLRCWTAKEAYLKGTGEGLSRPLATVSIDVAGEGGMVEPMVPTVLDFEGPPDAAGWSLTALPLQERYVGVLAMEGESRRAVGWSFPERLSSWFERVGGAV
jgi:4'-phosphopantetheinyl transferase